MNKPESDFWNDVGAKVGYACLVLEGSGWRFGRVRAVTDDGFITHYEWGPGRRYKSIRPETQRYTFVTELPQPIMHKFMGEKMPTPVQWRDKLFYAAVALAKGETI